MLDLSTNYLGFKLPHPLISGACPLADTIDGVRRLEDGGVSAIVLRSLFEEQLTAEAMATHRATDLHADAHGEAQSYFPSDEGFVLGPHEYLEHLRCVKETVDIPVIASLNGSTLGRWIEYAKLIQVAGADALELNVFYVPMRVDETSAVIERRAIEMVAEIRKVVKIPLAVKLSPFYTAFGNFAAALESAGADGLVIFNRFYEPDINVEQLEYESQLHLSQSSELLLRLRWLALLSGQLKASLAVTGGVHTAVDAIKAVMAGAHCVQLVSALLRGGAERVHVLLREMRAWMQKFEYESLKQMLGSMNAQRCPDPAALARGNYIHMLQTWGA